MSEHIVTSLEISKVLTLGFNIEVSGMISAENFINKCFKGFDLLRFVQETEKHLKPVAEDTLVKVVIIKDEIPPKLSIKYLTTNADDPDHGLLFSRTFMMNHDEIIVKHDFLSLPLAARGKRLGRKVLKFCLQHYLDMNVAKIKIHAALEDGGYEWAKAGFRASEPSEMLKILQESKTTLNTVQYQLVERLFYDYYKDNPKGTAFPIIEWSGFPFMKAILKRNDWHGEIDLKNPEDLFNFNEYVNG